MKTRGFTFIELLVVISLIGVFASIIMASINVARAKARDSVRAQEVHQIDLAVQQYVADHGHAPDLNGCAAVTSGNHIDPMAVSSCIAVSTAALDSPSGMAWANFTSSANGIGSYMHNIPPDPCGSGAHCVNNDGASVGYTYEAPAVVQYNCAISNNGICPQSADQLNTSYNVYTALEGGSVSSGTGSRPLPSIFLTASPANGATAGTHVTISWSVANASTCTFSQTSGSIFSSSVGPVSVAGTASATMGDADSTVVLSCSGSGGSTSKSVTVAPIVYNGSVPTMSLQGPSSAGIGDAVTFNWTSTGASSCILSFGKDNYSGYSSAVSPAGTFNMIKSGPDINAVLECTGPGGTASTTAVVGNATVVPTVSLTHTPNVVAEGQNATFTWSSTNADTCVMEFSPEYQNNPDYNWPNVAPSGSVNVAMGTTDIVDTLTCTGPGGSASTTDTVITR